MSLQLSVAINGGQRCQIRFQHRHTFQRVIDLLRVNKLIPPSIDKSQIKIVSGQGANAKAFKYDDYIINSVQSGGNEPSKVDIQFQRSQISQQNSSEVNLQNSAVFDRRDLQQHQQRKARVQNIIKIFVERFEKKDFGNIKKYHDADEEIVKNVANIAKIVEKDYALYLFYKECVSKLTENQNVIFQKYKPLFKQEYAQIAKEIHQISESSSEKGFMKKSGAFTQKKSEESMKNVIHELEQKLADINEKNSELQIENMELKKEKEQTNKLSLLMTQQYEMKIVQGKQRQEKLLKEQIKKYEDKIKNLEKQIKSQKNNEETVKKHQKEIAFLVQKNKKLSVQNEELEKQILANKSLTQHLQDAQARLKEIQAKNKMLQSQLKNSAKRVEQYELNSKLLRDECEKIKKQAEELREQIEELKNRKNLSPLQEKIRDAEQNRDNLQLSFEELAIKIGKNSREVLSKITNFAMIRFKTVRVVYEFDPQERYSPKKIADGILDCSNLLIFCKCVGGGIIGGFATLNRRSISDQSPLSRKGKPQKKKGFLFNSNLTQDNLTFYQLRQNKEPLMPDGDFLIFGNEELCLDYSTGQLSRRCPNNIRAQLFCYQLANDRRLNLLNSRGADQIQLESYIMLTCEESQTN